MSESNWGVRLQRAKNALSTLAVKRELYPELEGAELRAMEEGDVIWLHFDETNAACAGLPSHDMFMAPELTYVELREAIADACTLFRPVVA